MHEDPQSPSGTRQVRPVKSSQAEESDVRIVHMLLMSWAGELRRDLATETSGAVTKWSIVMYPYGYRMC